MSEMRNCLLHNRVEQCVRIGMGFSRFIHPELDWMCSVGLKKIDAFKQPAKYKESWNREYKMDWRQ